MFRNKFLTVVLLALAMVALPSFSQTADAEVFGNRQVIEMHQLGLPDAVVVAKIKATNGKYDTSINGLKALKHAGISNDVITAILESQQKPTSSAVAVAPVVPKMFQDDPNDPMVRYEPGNYIKGDDGSLTKLETGKLTFKPPSSRLLFVPFASLGAKSKWYFNDVTPFVTKSHRPEFTFYFATKMEGRNPLAPFPIENMVIVKLEREDGRLMLTERVFGDLSKSMFRLKLEKVYKNIVYKAVLESDLPDGDYALGNYDFDQAKGGFGSSQLTGSQFVGHGLFPFTVKGSEVK